MAAIILTETALANRALQYVGAQRLTNIWSDTSKNAVEIQNCYHMLRRAELRRNVWRFAVREAVLRPVGVNTRILTFGAWATGTTYAINDVVLGSDGRVYYSLIAGNLGNDPSTRLFTKWSLYFGPDMCTEYVTTWSSSVAYLTGDHTVGSDGQVYIAVQNTTNNNPVGDGNVHWTLTTDGVTASSTSTANSFWSGELVCIGSNVYLSLVNQNVSVPPSAGKWLALSTPPTRALFNFIYPIGAGPLNQATTRNVYRLPLGYVCQAPAAPKLGSFRDLGAPTNLQYDDWQFENDYFTSIWGNLIIFRFCADIDDPTLFDPMFAEGFATRIALSIGEVITQSTAKVQMLTAMYKQFMSEARIKNGIETGPTEPPLDEYLTTRY